MTKYFTRNYNIYMQHTELVMLMYLPITSFHSYEMSKQAASVPTTDNDYVLDSLFT